MFVHESFFSGVNDKASRSTSDDVDLFWDSSYFEPPESRIRNHVNILMEQHELNVVPYRRNAELSVMAASFIEQNEKNLIFRLYIPSERMWSLEAEKLLQLFRDYLAKVSGLKIRQDQYRTNQGVVHEFYGDQILSPSTLPKEFADFSKLLDLCVASPSAATELLVNKNIEIHSVHAIVERYAKEAKRLHVDLKQEREKRILSIRHRMESELIDIVNNDDWPAINHLIDISVPRVEGVSSSIGLNSATAAGTTIINISPQIIGSVHGVVAKEITGNQTFGIEANQFLELISKYGDSRRAELESAVYELEDKDVKQADRISAKQKLKGFLFKIGDKIGDVAFGILQTYIEKQIGL